MSQTAFVNVIVDHKMTKNTAAKKVPRRSKRQQGQEVTPMEMKKNHKEEAGSRNFLECAT